MKQNVFIETAKGRLIRPIVFVLPLGLLLFIVGQLLGIGIVTIFVKILSLLGLASQTTAITALTFLNYDFGVFLVFFAWVKWVERRPISSMGLFKNRAGVELLKGWLLGGAMFTLIIFLLGLFGIVQIDKINLTVSSLGFLILFILAWQVQSAGEELMTRGWLLPVLASHHRRITAVSIVSVLFAAMHLLNPNVTLISFANATLFGLMMCLYLIWKGNLWGAFGIHAAWNCFQGSIFGVQVSGLDVLPSAIIKLKLAGPDFLTGGKFGIEGSLVTLVIYASVCFFLYLKICKKVAVRPQISSKS